MDQALDRVELSLLLDVADGEQVVWQDTRVVPVQLTSYFKVKSICTT